MASEDYLLVASIDFGTTYSGYAFQLTSEYDKADPTKKIFSPQSWNEGPTKLVSMKTPTCLLLDCNKDIDSFGYVAEEKYADLCMDNDHRNWYFFRRFKMKLHDTNGLKKTTMLDDETGKSLPALTVFSKSIECLKKHLVDLLGERDYHVLPHQTKWVLTVPAIWDDTAKGFMREAAEQAAIPKEHLSISLEPEAASLFCQYLPVEKFKVGGGFKFSDARPGTAYMIVDLGGGTADMTVHEKISSGKLKEICCASGGPWGGTAVDGAFISLISGIIGGPVMATFMREQTYDYLELMREFESVKRNVRLDTTDEIRIKLPVTLNDTCLKVVKKDFKTLVKVAKKDKQITFVGDKCKFDASLMKGLFKKATDKIVNHMKDILNNTPAGKKVSLILMVGGFSESAYVQDVIKAEFHEKNGRKVLIPNDAGISVVQGAVVYGRQPGNITSRILRFTYGAAVKVDFVRGFHDPARLEIVAGEELCCDTFGKFIEVGSEVTTGLKICKDYTTDPHEKLVTLRVFVTPQADALYIDEKGCKKLGELQIRIPEATSERGNISVDYIFGDTELHVRAVDKKTMTPCETYLKMLE